MIKAVARSRGWFEELASGSVRALAEIARRESIACALLRASLSRAVTAPSIVEAICGESAG